MQFSAKLDLREVRQALEKARAALLAHQTLEGHWVGELSSSALSTATAVTALAVVQQASPEAVNQGPIQAGLAWLAQNQSADGGWGDTIRSLSNISTTTLVWAALGATAQGRSAYGQSLERAEQWLIRQAGGIDPERLSQAIVARYGKDRTFSVPILTMCALAGRLGSGRAAWQNVIPLPFELAAVPHQLYAALRLPVVSYALPALIAIGQARHHHAPSTNPLVRWVRQRTRSKTLRVLTGIQPVNGGFLEATPLTSFVTMSLAGSGQVHHQVTRLGVKFLRQSQRTDGSWPIDTNLSTWVTTLAVDALGQTEKIPPSLRSWILGQQYQQVHPYTHARPGGWAWTNLPGGVPDADDTAGALLALRGMASEEAEVCSAARQGLKWLMDLQNSDGGIPTFCRGWGALPFDRSSADISAHAIRAWLAWEGHVPASLQSQLVRASRRALRFLLRTQRHDGSWVPLWFGNQHGVNDENPTYGTSRVLSALTEAARHPQLGANEITDHCRRAVDWFLAVQNSDGGWGGAKGAVTSVEETALAVETLAKTSRVGGFEGLASGEAISSGVRWLMAKIQNDDWETPAPIGFYFAKLWYYEKLYPLIFTVGALRQVTDVAHAFLRASEAGSLPPLQGTQ